MAKRKDRPQLLLIEWFDATGGTGWRDVRGCLEDKLAQVFTTGLFIDETDDHICVAQNFSADENAALVDNTTLIPKANIVNVDWLITEKESKKCQAKTKAKTAKKSAKKPQRKS